MSMFVTFAVIAYNEEKALPGLLSQIAVQDYPHDQMEILLVNSLSSDGTRKVMEDFQKKYGGPDDTGAFARVAVLENPGKTLPCGWNVILKEMRGEAVVRVDAHARIPADFVSRSVKVLEEGEDVAGGRRPNIAEKDTPWANTLLMAESSMFGSSFASYRRGGKKTGTAKENEKLYVNSVFHGIYRKKVFEDVGPYNETLKRTEDNEMHWRIRQAGYKIRFAPEIISWEYIRGSLRAMLRQKAANGYWIALTCAVCPKCLSAFYFVPLIFTLLAGIGTGISVAGAVSGMTGMFVQTVQVLTGLLWGIYITLAVLMSIGAGVQNKSRKYYFWMLPVLFLLLHVSYGLGTLSGFISLPFKRHSLKKSDVQG
ncbi:MAG: glycosyltransferase family 2 protein [Lachnospiraceae bacterium]|jgi:cellulose synthase/poly-beta-1,6-N-acetylglucosamine synthase-like glycosyltransferase